MWRSRKSGNADPIVGSGGWVEIGELLWGWRCRLSRGDMSLLSICKKHARN